MTNLFIPATGLLYLVLFWGLSLTRGEGFPKQMVVESLVLTILASGLQLSVLPIHPTIFFLLLYLITMRARLLSDLGNLLTKRQQYNQANNIFNLALRLWPDAASRRIVRINQAVTFLRIGSFAQAEALFRSLLAELPSPGFSTKLEAAVHYNLALTLQYIGDKAGAIEEFNRTVACAPKSIYAHGARIAIKKGNETQPTGRHEETATDNIPG